MLWFGWDCLQLPSLMSRGCIVTPHFLREHHGPTPKALGDSAGFATHTRRGIAIAATDLACGDLSAAERSSVIHQRRRAGQSPRFEQVTEMGRLGLIVYLMLATTAGPWPCCCAVRRLLGDAAFKHRATACHHGNCSHYSCCHPQAGKRTRNPDGSAPYQKPECPCRQIPARLAVLPESVRAPTANVPGFPQRNSGGSAVLADRAHTTGALTFAMYAVRESDLACPTPRQMLSTLHVLLC
jgi:hypothetical protein